MANNIATNNSNLALLIDDLEQLVYSLDRYEQAINPQYSTSINSTTHIDSVMKNEQQKKALNGQQHYHLDDNMNLMTDSPCPHSTSMSTTALKSSSTKNDNGGKFCTEVVVKSSAHVSYIVGKQGAKIRQIRQDTGTFIQTPVNGEEPVFVISGKRDKVMQAKVKLEEAAKEFDFSIFVEACTYRDGDKIRNNLFLPPRYIGLVVGKKGSIIKRIMDVSGTNIVTPKVNTLNGFKIHGTTQQIRIAIDLIKEHILTTTNNGVTIEELELNQVEISLVIREKQQQQQQQLTKATYYEENDCQQSIKW